MKIDKTEPCVTFNEQKDYWQCAFFLPSGRRTSRKLEGVPREASRQEAIRAARKLNHLEKQRQIKMHVLIDSYMRSEEMPKRQDSYRGYKSNIEKWIRPEWGEQLVSEVRENPGRVKRWVNELP